MTYHTTAVILGLTPTAECVSSLELPPQLVATYVLVEGIKTRVTERESWPTNRAFPLRAVYYLALGYQFPSLLPSTEPTLWRGIRVRSPWTVVITRLMACDGKPSVLRHVAVLVVALCCKVIELFLGWRVTNEDNVSVKLYKPNEDEIQARRILNLRELLRIGDFEPGKAALAMSKALLTATSSR
jgi:hypothetical protein